MGWKLHAARLAVLGRMPFQDSLRRAKRRLCGCWADPDNLRCTLENLADMERALAQMGRHFNGANIIEIGSGWFPAIPVMLSARGARRVIMSDLTPYLDEGTFATTLEFLKPWLETIPGAAEKRTLADFRLEYRAPLDLDKVADGSVDFVISRTVLEHIQPAELTDLLARLKPKLSTNGLMVHCVDHSDHFEHLDKSISRINFLTWSPKTHQVINWLTKQGENRLRHHEYRRIFEAAGFDVVNELTEIHQPTLQAARTLRLHSRFAAMTPEQLSILTSTFVLAPIRQPQHDIQSRAVETKAAAIEHAGSPDRPA